MPKQQKVWVRVKALTAEEKTAIAMACDDFINQKLKPRFLPEIRPTEFNYPVDIFGKWRGSKYSFIARYRSGFPDNLGEEFNAPFTRLDHIEEHISETCFDVMWRRHTGQWWRLYPSVTLEEALQFVESDGLLQPHYAKRVEKLAKTGGNPNYDEAARLIARMATLRGAEAQAAYVADLKQRFHRKRNLMRLLE